MDTIDWDQLGAEFLQRISVNSICPDVAFDCERPAGETVSLESWRKELAEGRKNSVGKPGIFLDRSQTGAGKSFADREAIKIAGRSLIVTPTHDQCREVVEELRSDNVNAVGYPKRSTDGDNPTCWNTEADNAEAAGLPVGAAVCSTCELRDQCNEYGYLAQIGMAEEAEVAVATHMRVAATGLSRMSSDRQFISIHEDATDMLFPTNTMTVGQLRDASQVVGHVLNCPKWLDFLGATHRENEDGNLVPDPERQERRETLDTFLRRLDRVISDLISTMNQAGVTTGIPGHGFALKPQQLERVLWRAMSELKPTVSGKLPWRGLISIATGDYCNLGVLVDDSCSPQPKLLIVTWRNLPDAGATCWIADATADQSLIEMAAGIAIEDRTPEGHLKLKRPVTQIEEDIKRRTSPEMAQQAVRGLLHEHSNCRSVGVITHGPLVKAVKDLGPPFADRISRLTYFGSGEDRASNSWFENCDKIIVLGTPRLPPQAVRARLFQLGLVDEAAKDGEWSPKLNWRGWTIDGSPRIVSGHGYVNEAWQQVHRSMVRAAIIQAAGRGRGLLDNGCEVLILSNEECGFPLDQESRVEPISSAAMIVLNALRKELDRVHVMGRLEVTTREVAEKATLSEKQTRDWLRWLEEQELVQRKGQRGGWLLAS